MSHPSITNNLYNNAAYIFTAGQNQVIKAWGYVPTKDVIITAIANVILNKYAQVAACGTAAAFSAFNIRKNYTTYVSTNTVANLNKPIMIWKEVDGVNGKVQEEVQATKTVLHFENGETCSTEELLFEMEYKGSNMEFIKKNWKLPAFATACVVAAVVRILLP